MKVKQLNELILPIVKQVYGDTEITDINTIDLVDAGTKVFSEIGTDNFVKSLVDRVGKVIFVNRKYQGNGISVLKDAWEFGAVLQKIEVDIQDDSITTNDTWNLNHKQSYSQDTFYQPKAEFKLYSKKITFEIDVSFAETQVKSCFNSINELNTFVSMIYNAVENAFTVKLDSLIMTTINTMSARTLASKKPLLSVNLLEEYKKQFADDISITKDNALKNADFLRFASSVINTYVDRVSKISTLFNLGSKKRFTPKEDLNIILLSDFKNACNSYLQADTFHKELLELPNAETVPYWQGSGIDYSFDSVSSIHITTKDMSDKNITINQSGVLGVMFDKNAVMVCNEDKRVATHYNAKGEFFTNFYKFDCSYLNDVNENYVVFYIDDVETTE